MKRGTKGSAGKMAKENRHNPRYWLCMPVLFWWKRANGRVDRGEGFSRDISLRGIYVWSEVHPPSEANVTLELFLTGIRGNTAPPLYVKTEAKVVRVEECEGTDSCDGFAVSCERLNLLEPKVRCAGAKGN